MLGNVGHHHLVGNARLRQLFIAGGEAGVGELALCFELVERYQLIVVAVEQLFKMLVGKLKMPLVKFAREAHKSHISLQWVAVVDVTTQVKELIGHVSQTRAVLQFLIHEELHGKALHRLLVAVQVKEVVAIVGHAAKF